MEHQQYYCTAQKKCPLFIVYFLVKFSPMSIRELSIAVFHCKNPLIRPIFPPIIIISASQAPIRFCASVKVCIMCVNVCMCAQRLTLQQQVCLNKLIKLCPPVFNSSETFLKDLWAAGKGRGLNSATVEHMATPQRTHTASRAQMCTSADTHTFYLFRITRQSSRFRGTAVS